MSELSEQIRQILANQLEIKAEKITNTLQLVEDLAVDSLDIVELTIKFENTFDIDLPEGDLAGLDRVKDLIAMISERYTPSSEASHKMDNPSFNS